MKKMLPELVTPLTNRKTRKAVEQSFTSSVDTIDFEITNVGQALCALGVTMKEEVVSVLDKYITDTFEDKSNLFDARYFVAYNIKSIVNDKRPAYKIPVSITEYEKLKTYLKSSVVES